MNRLNFAFAALLTFGFPGGLHAQPKFDAATTKSEVLRLGPRAFIAKHFDDALWIQGVVAGIGRADLEWLEVGAILRPGSDAASGEDLTAAFFDALAVNPLRVLPIIQRLYGGTAEGACNQTFEADLPKLGVARYLQQIERGLALAKTSAELELAAGCRRGLDKTRKYAKKNGLK